MTTIPRTLLALPQPVFSVEDVLKRGGGGGGGSLLKTTLPNLNYLSKKNKFVVKSHFQLCPQQILPTAES